VRFSDAQCGFKAARRDSLLSILGEVENQNWFFDTELLYIAQQQGLTLFELPVRWIEDPDSSVRLASTVVEDLSGIRRLRRGWRRSGSGPGSASRSRPGRDRHEPGVGATRG
jgi:hypothetical protein